jgi:hypothetical protein
VNASKKLGLVTEFTIQTLFYSLPSIWFFPHMVTAIGRLEKEYCLLEEMYQHYVKC